MNNYTPFSEIGEFGFINRIDQLNTIKNKNIIKGIGDDAAVINNANEVTLISTDILIENVHFDITYTNFHYLGYKAAVVNFSDIIAMNSYPMAITVSIAISNRYSVEDIENLYKGILEACKKYNVDLVGGDTTSSRYGIFISITVIGQNKKDKIVYRNGAKETDLICVSGNLGAAYCGLLLLEREKKVFIKNSIQPSLEKYEYIIRRQLKPEARIDIIKNLEELSIIPTSMIDISDGLASEIIHICNQSDKGCYIYEEKIPINYNSENFANEVNIHPITAALNGGEDYELLFTVPVKLYEEINKIDDITVIGYITNKDEGRNMETKSGNVIQLKALGWNSFNNNDEKL